MVCWNCSLPFFFWLSVWVMWRHKGCTTTRPAILSVWVPTTRAQLASNTNACESRIVFVSIHPFSLFLSYVHTCDSIYRSPLWLVCSTHPQEQVRTYTIQEVYVCTIRLYCISNQKKNTAQEKKKKNGADWPTISNQGDVNLITVAFCVAWQ